MAFSQMIPPAFAFRNARWNKIFTEIHCQRNAFQNVRIHFTSKTTQQCFVLRYARLIQITSLIWPQSPVLHSVRLKDGLMTLKGFVLLVAPTILLLKTQHGDACLNVWEVLWLLPMLPHGGVFRNALLVGLQTTLLSNASKNVLKSTIHSLRTLQELVSKTVPREHMQKALQESVWVNVGVKIWQTIRQKCV